MSERRNSKRVSVSKHVGEHDLIVEINGHYYYAALLDISPHGAKLRTDKPPMQAESGNYGTVVDDYYEHKYLQDKNYSVAWTSNDYVGVRFDSPLDVDQYGPGSYYSYYN